jgi:UDP-N-acetylmuramate--alanine ligase
VNFSEIKKVYFIGIGGIGMSALARYFISQKKEVMGYDRTETVLTRSLVSEGVDIHYEDKGWDILDQFATKDTLVVYTPAVPDDFGELKAFQEHGFSVIKRAKALGIISDAFKTIAVAGTHGKTTTSSILAYTLTQTNEGCNAFVGGILSNYRSNCIINADSGRVVVEADEFDRSFLHLKPNYIILTSLDADHLDIYGDKRNLLESFNEFVNQAKSSSTLMYHSNLDLSSFNFTSDLRIVSYGTAGHSDWKLHSTKYEDGKFYFDISNHGKAYRNIEFGLPGQHNAENATAVFAMCKTLGVEEDQIRAAFIKFRGVKRRFDYKVRRDDMIVIDDYAHHPTEVQAFLESVRKLYPDKKITAIFQPHLFSRTLDFMDEFAESLSLCDELFLLPIYPAREEPIEGVTSDVLLGKVSMSNKHMSSLDGIIKDLQSSDKEVVCILGAGDIDTVVEPIANLFKE